LPDVATALSHAERTIRELRNESGYDDPVLMMIGNAVRENLRIASPTVPQPIREIIDQLDWWKTSLADHVWSFVMVEQPTQTMPEDVRHAFADAVRLYSRWRVRPDQFGKAAFAASTASSSRKTGRH
jgi:hypothetical protein